MGAITSGTAAAAGEPAATDAGWAGSSAGATLGEGACSLISCKQECCKKSWPTKFFGAPQALALPGPACYRSAQPGAGHAAQRLLLLLKPAPRRTELCLAGCAMPGGRKNKEEGQWPGGCCPAAWPGSTGHAVVARHRGPTRCRLRFPQSLQCSIEPRHASAALITLDRSFKRTESKLTHLGQGRHDSD